MVVEHILPSLLLVLALPIIDRVVRRLRLPEGGKATLNLITWNALLIVSIDESVVTGSLVDLSIRKEWQLVGGLDVGHLLNVTLRENKIDLLERALLSFWVEEVDEWDEQYVHARKEHISSPPNIINHDRHNHNDHEVGDPVNGRGHRVCAATCADWVDLSRVQPWKWQPSSAEEGNIGEETDSCSVGGRLGVWDETGEEIGRASCRERVF